MGQVSDDINDGLMCQVCGVWMEDIFSEEDGFNDEIFDNPPGYPRTCEDCKKDK